MHPGLRKMVRETRMDKSSLIYPMFIVEGENIKQEISAMPGQYRYSADRMGEKLESLLRAGVSSVLFFGIPKHKDAMGSMAYAQDGVVQRAFERAKKEFPGLYLIGDVCMCEYTSHGHCGVLCKEGVDNDRTLEYLARTAVSQVQAGADMVNDIWGLKYDETLAQVIADFGVSCCLMHNRDNTEYHNFMEDVKADLGETLTIARNAGIAEDKIILDPGVGFGKTYEHNLEVIGKLGELRELGFPLLLGTSRKSVIGITLDLPVTERLEGTLVTTVMGMLAGCAFVRVHDVLANKRAIQMAEAIMRYNPREN